MRESDILRGYLINRNSFKNELTGSIKNSIGYFSEAVKLDV